MDIQHRTSAPGGIVKKQDLASLTAEDIMSTTVLSLYQEAPLDEAVQLFIDNNVSAVPVLDDAGKAVGVFTKTDLARFEGERRGLPSEEKRPKVAKGKKGKDFVKTWMTPFVMTVKPDASLPAIARTMVKNGLHHIFVKSGPDLIGIISTFDVLRFVSRSLNSDN